MWRRLHRSLDYARDDGGLGESLSLRLFFSPTVAPNHSLRLFISPKVYASHYLGLFT